MSHKPLLTLAELSQTSGLSASTIRRLVRAERIPFFQPWGKGGKLLFPGDAIEKTSPVTSADSVTCTRLAGKRPCWMQDNS
jgi:excisionase family DNA binding protein